MTLKYSVKMSIHCQRQCHIILHCIMVIYNVRLYKDNNWNHLYYNNGETN